MKPTRWKLYNDGEDTWQAMIAACEKAEHGIDLEQYIFVNDEIGKKIIDVCVRKAAEGVHVRFLWDAAGSFNLFGSSLVEDLRKKGIDLVFFKTLVPGFFKVPDYRSWFFRDHRKTLIIDGRMGFTGGVGVWEKFRNWRDTHIEIEGPVVADMQMAFDAMWTRATHDYADEQERKDERRRNRKMRKILRKTEQGKIGRNGSEFSYVLNDPLPGKRKLYHAFLDAIRGAHKSVFIVTPYFVPTRRLARVIRLAAHRGVDVRIVIPKASNHPVVDIGARSFFQAMLDSGVKIYLYTGNAEDGGMIHSKIAVIDERWATLGTLNLDTISLLYNFEANIVSTNREFGSEIVELFWNSVRRSDLVDKNEWKNRLFLLKTPEFVVKFIRNFL
jgi:cardiolipin synthase